jgi:hypothetical protein
MKKHTYGIAVMMMAVLLTAALARAETSPAADEQALMFKNRKEEMLLNINNRMAEMQKHKSCIEATADMESMHKCMPPMPPMPPMMGGPEGKEKEPPAAPGADPHGH